MLQEIPDGIICIVGYWQKKKSYWQIKVITPQFTLFFSLTAATKWELHWVRESSLVVFLNFNFCDTLKLTSTEWFMLISFHYLVHYLALKYLYLCQIYLKINYFQKQNLAFYSLISTLCTWTIFLWTYSGSPGSYHWICSQNSNLFTSHRKTVLKFVVNHRKVPVTFWLLPSLDSTQF